MSREKLTLTLVVLGTLAAAVILNDRPSAVEPDPEIEAAEATEAAASATDAAAIAADAAADAVMAAAATPPAYTPPAYSPPSRTYYAPSSSYEDIHGSSACTSDCSGHDAGYAWAEEKGIDDIDDCGGNSNSFIEGCEAYVEDNS